MRKPSRKKGRSGAPAIHVPLPKKTEKRHGDAKKFHRPREEERLQREIEV